MRASHQKPTSLPQAVVVHFYRKSNHGFIQLAIKCYCFLASSGAVLYTLALRQAAPQGLQLELVLFGSIAFLFAVFSAINIYDILRSGFSTTRR